MTDGANALERANDGDNHNVGVGTSVRDGRNSSQRSGDVVRLQAVHLPSAPATETAVLLGMIERASSDPTIDIDRIERMYSLYERAAARSAKSAYIDALMRAKSEFPDLIKTGTATYKDKDTKQEKEAFKYAKWEDVCGLIEPVLAKHGLLLTFTSEQPTADRVTVTGVLSHRDGHSERAQMALGCDASGGKNNAQGWGSSISYGKRYTSFALLNLVGTDDRDTDGAPPPMPHDYITEEQEKELQALIKETGTNIDTFLAIGKVESLADITADRFQKAKNLLLQKKEAKKT